MKMAEAYIWEPECIRQFTEEAYKYMMICDECEALSDGSCGHGTLISEFCKEGHTKEMGDPMHHCDTCGADYPCSQSNGHTTCIKCGNAWCYTAKGTHFTYACDGDDHSAASCGIEGHYECDGEVHEVSIECLCGAKFYYCNDGMNQYELHIIEMRCPGCGNILCNQPDIDHSAASCGIAGHYACDGEWWHVAGDCGVAGHYKCDGATHEPAVVCACGAEFYYCQDGLNQYELHTIEKTCPGCKDILCNQSDINHGAASCGIAGHYACDGRDHTSCGEDKVPESN